MPAAQAPHRGNPSPCRAEVGGAPRFEARAQFIASPSHAKQPEGAAMKCSGLSRRGRAVHTLAVLIGALVAATPAAAHPIGHNGQIAFVRSDPLVAHSVYTVNPDGSHEQRLLSDPVDLNGPRWSRDGGAIVAFAGGDGSAAWIVDADTGTHRAIPNPDPGS